MFEIELAFLHGHSIAYLAFSMSEPHFPTNILTKSVKVFWSSCATYKIKYGLIIALNKVVSNLLFIININYYRESLIRDASHHGWATAVVAGS